MAKQGLLTTADPLIYPEFIKLLENLRKDQDYIWELYVLLSVAMGLRSYDVRTLRWEEVLDKGYVCKTEHKTNKTRKIKLHKTVACRIRNLYILLNKPAKDSYIFLNKTTDRPFTIWTINRKVRTFKVKYNLNIKAFSSHSFRKTFGRRIYDTSENKSDALIKLQEMLNHTNPRITLRYIGLVQKDIDDAYNKITI